MIQIQATIIGYKGKAASLFSAYDQDTNILIVGAEADYRSERRAGTLVITNDKTIDQRDSLFDNDKLADSINAFFSLKNGVASDGKSARIIFNDRAARANPENSIEIDSIDASGPRFRISEGVSNSQIAALATCLHAVKVSSIGAAIKMADSLQQLLAGNIVTVGAGGYETYGF